MIQPELLMSHEAYRAPEAPLIDPAWPLEPRSAVVAVVLGLASALLLAAAVATFLSPDTLARWFVGAPFSVVTGVTAGWVAARYRRGPWRGVTAGIVALDLVMSLAAVASSPRETPGPLLTALFLAASVMGDVAGGYWGRARPRPRN